MAIVVLALVVLSAACAHPREAAGDLNFFLATRDLNAYQREPGRFERVARSAESGGDLYIERASALSVPLAKAKHATVEKKAAVVDIQTILRDPLGSSREGPPRDGQEYRYTVTFEFDEQAAQTFRDFAPAHDARSIEVRIGKRHLAVVRLMGPFLSARLTVPLAETDEGRIREALGELKAKTTWK